MCINYYVCGSRKSLFVIRTIRFYIILLRLPYFIKCLLNYWRVLVYRAVDLHQLLILLSFFLLIINFWGHIHHYMAWSKLLCVFRHLACYWLYGLLNEQFFLVAWRAWLSVGSIVEEGKHAAFGRWALLTYPPLLPFQLCRRHTRHLLLQRLWNRVWVLIVMNIVLRFRVLRSCCADELLLRWLWKRCWHWRSLLLFRCRCFGRISFGKHGWWRHWLRRHLRVVHRLSECTPLLHLLLLHHLHLLVVLLLHLHVCHLLLCRHLLLIKLLIGIHHERTRHHRWCYLRKTCLPLLLLLLLYFRWHTEIELVLLLNVLEIGCFCLE